jgi:hypothetical protein
MPGVSTRLFCFPSLNTSSIARHLVQPREGWQRIPRSEARARSSSEQPGPPAGAISQAQAGAPTISPAGYAFGVHFLSLSPLCATFWCVGAGKSSISLIDYLVKHAPAQQWQITVADVSAEVALQKTKNRKHTRAIAFDFGSEPARSTLIKQADVVISMLPAFMHPTIAEDCIKHRKHLVTPSYISEAMLGLHDEAKKRGLVFMNEIGLDPGIDHMSSMQVIDQLKAEGKVITGYKSHCGGLIAPESDTNPWHYKFTWNPRNVVLAGQGGWLHSVSGKREEDKAEICFSFFFGMRSSKCAVMGPLKATPTAIR